MVVCLKFQIIEGFSVGPLTSMFEILYLVLEVDYDFLNGISDY